MRFAALLGAQDWTRSSSTTRSGRTRPMDGARIAARQRAGGSWLVTPGDRDELGP